MLTKPNPIDEAKAEIANTLGTASAALRPILACFSDVDPIVYMTVAKSLLMAYREGEKAGLKTAGEVFRAVGGHNAP